MRSKLKVLVAVFLMAAMVFTMFPASAIAGPKDKGNRKPGQTVEETQAPETEVVETEAPTEEVETETVIETEAVETEAVETVQETEPPVEETEVAYPAQTFEGENKESGISVTVDAPEGALPAGTEMKLTALTKDQLAEVSEKVDGNLVEAIDISFWNDDQEIEPLTTDSPIVVTMSSAKIAEVEDPTVVHIPDDDAEVEEVKQVEDAAAADEVVFEADSFSVYAVISGDEIVTDRITYHFLDGEGNPYLFLNTVGETVSTQIIKDGESLQEVPAPGLIGENAFNGWFYYDMEAGTYGDEVVFGEAITVTETTDVYIKAHYGSVIYVTFWQYARDKDSGNNVVLERKQIPANDDGKYIMDMSTVTVPAPKTTLKFMGWSLTPGSDASEDAGDTPNSRPLLNNGNVEFTEDADVYPVYYSGIWIVFVSAQTGMGATYVPSFFITADSANASAAKPSNPTMTGYAFDGWFTTPEEDYISAESSGAFDFNTSFADLANYTNDRGEVVLYGHWKGGNTTYVVVYWKQQVVNDKNAEASAKTYDYAGQTDPISGTTGSSPTPTAAQRAADTGFQYSRYELIDMNDDGTTVASSGIKADGSSILNVYFDRKLIYFRFRTSTNTSYTGNWTSSSYATTYTGLYGQTWQQAGYTTNWPAPTGSNRWGYYATGNNTIGMSYLGQFIPPEDVRDTNGVDVRFYYNGTSSYTVNLYVQNADGSWPTTTNISGRTGGTFNLTDKLEGFYVSAYRVGNSGSWRNVSHTTNADGSHNYNPSSVSNIGNGPLNLRYARESYDIKYLNPLNENPVLSPQSTLFGASLASAKPNVSSVDLGVPGYEWDGKWYKDKNCTVEFDFNTETMPMGGTKVYAGKTPIYFYIKVDPNGGELQTGQSTWRWVRYGDDTTYTYDNITRDYIEYKGSGTAYYYYYDEFDISRRDDIWNYTYMNTNPRTALYTTGEIPAGGGSAWLGTEKFTQEADAYSLIGWYDITDGTANMKPFKSGTAITRDTIIQAQWRRTGEYSVLYHIEAVDENGDDLMDAETGLRVEGANNPVDSAKYADKSDSAIMDKIGVVPAGYNFVGWYYDGKIYQPGDVFQILARLSDDNKTVHIYPVMEPVETLPVEVIDITYNPNGGEFTADADTELNAMIEAAKDEETGTYDPKLTTNEDGTKTISDLKMNEGLELLSADAVQNGVEIDGEKVLGRGYRLKEWNTKADGSGTSFALDTKIGVDDLEPVPNVVYAIWEEVFYVYHPATGEFQTLVKGDKTDRWALTTGFDPEGTVYKTQYTDYYYGGFAVYAAGNVAAEGITFKCGDVESGTIADSYWTRVKAAKSADKWNASDTGAVYYLKEVPTSYLAKPVSCTIRDNYGKGDITSLHFLSVTDTNIYRAGGIKLKGNDTKGTFAKNFKLTQNNGGETTITAQSQFGLEGYLTVVNNGTESGSYSACQAYWTTYDYVDVYGIEANIKDITID